jgi:hypothetical protein
VLARNNAFALMMATGSVVGSFLARQLLGFAPSVALLTAPAITYRSASRRSGGISARRSVFDTLCQMMNTM